MSRTRISREKVYCCNDCIQTGCPGHKIELTYNHTVDTVEVKIDEKPHQYYFDRTIFKTIKAMADELDLPYEKRIQNTSYENKLLNLLDFIRKELESDGYHYPNLILCKIYDELEIGLDYEKNK